MISDPIDPGYGDLVAAAAAPGRWRQSPSVAPGDVAPPMVHAALQMPGEPLDAATRDFMEPRFGGLVRSRTPIAPAPSWSSELAVGAEDDPHEQEAQRAAEIVSRSPAPPKNAPGDRPDFSGVRVHTGAAADASARAVGARAYTVGPHIVFRTGQYAPTTTAGRELLAHELVHVSQQGAGDEPLRRSNHTPPSKALAALDKLIALVDSWPTVESHEQRGRPEAESKALGPLEEESKAADIEAGVSALKERVKARMSAAGGAFALEYTDGDLAKIIARGQVLGLDKGMIEDLIYVGSRADKRIPADTLIEQMNNWATVVKARGFPYRFDDSEQFQRFSNDLLDEVERAGLSPDDVCIQGSSLRKPTARDVDIAVFVPEEVFDQMLIDRFDNRIARGRNKVSLHGKSHVELVQIAGDIETHGDNYSAQGRTFQHALKTGIINSHSDISKPLKGVKEAIASKYPALEIEAISVLVRGGQFDLLPNLPVKRG